MKKILFGLLVLATIASCKKSDPDSSCEVSVAGIAGNYKPTKAVAVIAGISTDVTSSVFDACDLSGVYQLKADKTVVYTETSTCSGNGTGTWDVVSGKITIQHSGNGSDYSGVTVANNCSTLTLSETSGTTTINYTFTKQ
jgi:hypothetical protein